MRRRLSCVILVSGIILLPMLFYATMREYPTLALPLRESKPALALFSYEAKEATSSRGCIWFDCKKIFTNASRPQDGFFNPVEIPEALKFVAAPIPGELLQHVRSLQSPFPLPQCSHHKPKQNFVYIKTHKTASDSLAALFRRFAYQRNLSQVIPVHTHINLGWPYDLQKAYHRPSKTGHFDTLVDHCKFTEQYLREIMPAGTVYITSWRESFSHLKSAMAYMSIRQWSGITEQPPDGMEVFLTNLKHYDEIYKRYPNPWRSRKSCIPPDISMARNSMAADLGFPVGFPPGVYPDFSDNFLAIREWLDHVNKVFSVVLLSDYFNHSLIMLKRMMCWSTKDILYVRMNTWNTKYRPSYRKEYVDNFRRWSAADYLAFELFNQTLWHRVEKWGREDFVEELNNFEDTLKTILGFCHRKLNGKTEDKNLDVPATKWSHGYQVDKTDCALMKDDLRKLMRKQYDENPVKVQQPPSKGVPLC